MPTVASASTMVSGLNRLPADADCTLCTFGPSEAGLTRGASNSAMT